MSSCSAVGAALVAVALPLVGCAELSDDEVGATVSAFTDPGRPAGERCALLAPATRASLENDEQAPCAEVLPQLPLGTGTVRSVEVWGEEAQVRLADDTLFLTRTDDGWRVLAGACSPQAPEQPYLCRLEAS